MYKLPDLNYTYDAFGTYISKDIMELHHSKHHQTYVDKLNAVRYITQRSKDCNPQSRWGTLQPQLILEVHVAGWWP